MSDKTIKLDLSQIGDGGLQEKVDKELERVIANILDPNTETKTARKLVITLTMKSDETRQTVATAMEVKSTLAPQKAVATTVLVGKKVVKSMQTNLRATCLVRHTLTTKRSFVQTLVSQSKTLKKVSTTMSLTSTNKRKRVIKHGRKHQRSS